MDENRTNAAASVIVLATGCLWGLYWLPVRGLADLGLGGGLGTLAIVATAGLLLAPFAALRWRSLRDANRLSLASVALGGFAFAMFSVALLHGRVAIIVILFYLTPVWSTLIGRYVLGWPVSSLRKLALVLGIAGLVLLLGANGQVPLPRGIGEWLGLVSGILWSVSSTGIRVHVSTGPLETGFVFVTGAVLSALILTLFLFEPAVAPTGPVIQIVGLTVLTGGLWWAVTMAAFMWAASRLEPARVGILLMTEVLVSAASAALIAGETLGPVEMVGGVLVLGAGLCELWPEKRRRRTG